MDEAEYEVSYFPTEAFAERSGWPEQNKIRLQPTEGLLRIPQYSEAKREHVLFVKRSLAKGENRPWIFAFTLSKAICSSASPRRKTCTSTVIGLMDRSRQATLRVCAGG